jgi:hypothetical protein
MTSQMSYLQRRISSLVAELERGTLKLTEDVLNNETGIQLQKDLLAIRRLPDGEIDLSSCSPLVRSTARSLYLLKRATTEEEQKAGQNNLEIVSPEAISTAMKDYFQILEDFFIEATGTQPEKFAVKVSFSEQIRKNAEIITQRSQKAWETYVPKILKFHSEHTSLLLGAKRAIGGLKSVMGGASRFPESAFDGLRKFALYTDTIFIPDPILPWLEVERAEERFRRVHLLQACHDLLRIKPLVDANLPYPAVVVFPSWEKSLEASDEQTQDGISQLMLDFFSHYLNANFEDESEIIDYVTNSGRSLFREAVERHRLFFAPGAESILPFDEALGQYKLSISTWRSQEWINTAEEIPSELLVLNGIMERIVPQFHVRDNAYTLDAQPLFWLEPHFHYFRLCSEAGNDELREAGLLQSKTLSTVQSLLHPNLAWLGNVPIRDIARLREENQNEELRRRLSSYVEELSESQLEDLDRVAAEVTRGIASLLAEHDREAKRINEEYDKKHTATIGVSILTAGVAFYPWLAPLLSTSALLAPVGKATLDFYNKFRDRQTLSRSLTGVLSQAKKS